MPVNAQLRTMPCVLRSGDVTGYPWGTIGQAVDYRLRYSFAITPSDQLVAHHGMQLYTVGRVGESVPMPAYCDMHAAWDFFDRLDATLARLKPVGRRLPPEAERELDRYCYVLALFETVYRSAGEYGPLYSPPRKRTVGLRGRGRRARGRGKPGRFDYHLAGMTYGRDYQADHASDIALARAGDTCVRCGGALEERHGIEAANTFKLGTRYSADHGRHVRR